MNAVRAISKEKLQKIVLVGMIALTGISGVWMFYGSKQWAALKKQKEEVAKLQKDVDDAKQSAQAIMRTAPLRDKMQAFVDTQRATMVSGDPFAWVVREIELLAENQPVRDVAPRTGTVVRHPRKDRYECYVTHIEFVGSYHQIGAFVEKLENRFPEAEIRMLDIAASEVPDKHRAALGLMLLVRPEMDWEKTAAQPTTEPKAKS
jgi:Tfp pilus assembly protein PilO